MDKKTVDNILDGIEGCQNALELLKENMIASELLEKQVRKMTDYMLEHFPDEHIEDTSMGIFDVITRKLDERKKPVVPEFVAEWFEDNKNNLDYEIWNSIHRADDFFINWINADLSDKPITTLVKMSDGYFIESNLIELNLVWTVYEKNTDDLVLKSANINGLPRWTGRMTDAWTTTNKDRAEAVAVLTDGRVGKIIDGGKTKCEY